MAKKEIRICNNCKKEYDRKQLKRSLGEYSATYMLGYCSSFCYTDMTIDKELDYEEII